MAATGELDSMDGLGSSSSNLSATSDSTPFDASQWLGRYHLENVFLTFGERGDPLGDSILANVEIFEDGTATMDWETCTFAPVHIAYQWEPDQHDGWLRLGPGEGESSLRFLAAEGLQSLRINLVDECGQLAFEIDGRVDTWSPFHPGASCWVDKCTDGTQMQVDYCEGEQPPPCP